MRPYEKFLLNKFLFNKYKVQIKIMCNYSFTIFPLMSFFHFLPKKRGYGVVPYLPYSINNLFCMTGSKIRQL